jgi:hypothetical protein
MDRLRRCRGRDVWCTKKLVGFGQRNHLDSLLDSIERFAGVGAPEIQSSCRARGTNADLQTTQVLQQGDATECKNQARRGRTWKKACQQTTRLG